MRIGIDARLWNESGVGRYTRNLVQELLTIDKKNNYVLFVLDKDYENFQSLIKNEKLKIVKTDIRWHSFSEQLKFSSVLNKEKLDLMHFPYFSIPIFYKKPFVVTIHDLIINHFPTGKASTHILPIYSFKRGAYELVLSRAIRKSKKIIVPSNATKKEITDHFRVLSSKIEVTYEGVFDNNAKFRRQNSTSRLRSGQESKTQNYFLYVGNAYPHKNLDRLIKAFMELKKEKRNDDLQLVFVGKEDYFYKKLKKKYIQEKNLIFLDFVTDEELSFIYRNAIALVVPSLMEGFGLTVLEAMQSSCFVLASDIQSFKEICYDVAIYFNPESTEDIKSKMEKILSLNRDEKESYIKLGLKRTKDFSWQKMAKETLKVYESAV